MMTFAKACIARETKQKCSNQESDMTECRDMWSDRVPSHWVRLPAGHSMSFKPSLG